MGCAWSVDHADHVDHDRDHRCKWLPKAALCRQGAAHTIRYLRQVAPTKSVAAGAG